MTRFLILCGFVRRACAAPLKNERGGLGGLYGMAAEGGMEARQTELPRFHCGLLRLNVSEDLPFFPLGTHVLVHRSGIMQSMTSACGYFAFN